MKQTRVGPWRSASACLACACAAVLLGALVTAGAGCGGSESASRVVRVGFLRNDLHQLAFYVAREKGFFKEQGLDIREGGAFNAGPEEMSSFSAGDLDIGYVGTAPCLTFAGQRMADVKIVAQANTGGTSLIVRPGLDVKEITDLEGRTIAVPGLSTVQDFLLHRALEKAGMEPSQVRKTVLKPPEMLPALAGAQVDAALAWEPYPSMARAQGAGRTLLSSREIWPDHPCCMVVADSAFIEKNPDAVRRFVAAHVKATRYIRDNRLEAADMAHLFTGQPTDVVRAAMKNIGFSFRPDIRKIGEYAVFMAGQGVIKEKNPAAFARSMVDSSFIPGDGK